MTEARTWREIQTDDIGDSMVDAMVQAGVEAVFFTSGQELVFYQEAIAKLRAKGRPAPRLITMTHEHASLNAALGYTAITGKPSVTAAHVDAGTLHHGGAIHTAWHTGLPILITAGFPPTSYAGSSNAARNSGGHMWLQQSYDQNGIVRQYVKWDHQMQMQDNAALMVSRALQLACSEPCGPVYLTIPPEVSLRTQGGDRYPTALQLGIARAPAPDEEGIGEIARRLVRAAHPFVIAGASGRDPATVAMLVELCELLGMPAMRSPHGAYLCFPMDHPLYVGSADLSAADVVLVIESDVPWIPGAQEPGDAAWVADVSLDAVKSKIPTFEFTADLRLTAGSRAALHSLLAQVKALLTPADRQRIAERGHRVGASTKARRLALEEQAKARAGGAPIDPLWLSYQIGCITNENSIVFDDTLPHNRVREFLHCNRPRSYFSTPASSGGWAPGAAFGAKLGAPERDVIVVTGDGFYMFGTATAALWSAAHYRAPYLTVVYQNRSYSTGTTRVAALYPGSLAAKQGYEGGYFDPPMDFAKEAEAAGGYGENVTRPEDVEGALQRGLTEVRGGRPAVIAVRLARLMGED